MDPTHGFFVLDDDGFEDLVFFVLEICDAWFLYDFYMGAFENGCKCLTVFDVILDMIHYP